MTATAEQYATAAELLRRVASQPNRLVANGDGDLAELRARRRITWPGRVLLTSLCRRWNVQVVCPQALTQALEVGAQACEQVEEADRARGDAELECEEAMLGAAHLWSLVERAAEVVDAYIAEGDGGTWETLTLAFELRQAVEAEPDELDARLLGELHAARVALRAADALAAAVHRGDRGAASGFLTTFQQANRAWRTAVALGRTAGEIGVVAGEESR